MEEKIKKAAEGYAENSGAYTHDYNGFVAGAEWALGMNGPKLDPSNLLAGYTVLRRAEEGVDAIWQKGNFRVFVGWDTSTVYLPALSVVGRAVRGPVVEYLHELEMLERFYGAK